MLAAFPLGTLTALCDGSERVNPCEGYGSEIQCILGGLTSEEVAFIRRSFRSREMAAQADNQAAPARVFASDETGGTTEPMECADFCAHPCGELNGVLEIECGACGPEQACSPGADGFPLSQGFDGSHPLGPAWGRRRAWNSLLIPPERCEATDEDASGADGSCPAEETSAETYDGEAFHDESEESPGRARELRTPSVASYCPPHKALTLQGARPRT